MKISKVIKGMIAVVALSAGVILGAVGAYAAGTCKVSADAAKIRETASTSAEVVGSTVKGSKLDVLGSTKDSDGYTWYKVYVDGNSTGYIRADLVTDVEGDFPSDSGSSSSSDSDTETETTTEQAEEPAEVITTTVNPSQYTVGTTTDTVSVREAASTKSTKKTTTAAGQDVAITGEATDDSGMLWYQISYGDINGFIRSDFLKVGEDVAETDTGEAVETSEPAEEPAAEVEQPVTTANQDYELRYEANDQGVDTWYLYDHIKGTRQSLDNIFAVMQQSQNMTTQDNEKASTLKKVVIVMGIVIVLLIIGLVIMFFKLKDSYEDWEDDDDADNDQDDYDEVVTSQSEPEPEDDDVDLDDEDIKIVTKRGKPRKASSITKPSKALQDERKEAWQSKNFLDIDDDMEFEFLDIDK